MRIPVLLGLLLLSSTALADQAYIQAGPWVVNRLPVMPGQNFHQRCLLQTRFSGTSSVQFIAEGQKLRGAIFILTEPAFKEEGRALDVVLTANSKSYEFPGRSLSKYAIAVEISEAYEAEFRKNLGLTELLRLKSGFNTYNFSVEEAKKTLDEALACTPPKAPEPVATAAPTPLAPPTAAEPVFAKSTVPLPPQTKIISATPEPVVPKAYIVQQGGSDMVLAEALPKILPPGYDFKFGQGASAGERISWQRGGDWLETLINALDEVGLQGAASGKTVTILPKLKQVAMPVDNGITRAKVIVKEPIQPVKDSDPSQPPSPGMKDEASALLAKMRLDEATLSAMLDENQTPAQEVIGEDTVPLLEKGVAKKSQDEMDEEALDNLARPALQKEGEGFTVYKAAKGESLQAVITRWSDAAGQPTDLDLKREYFLSKPITVQGDYDLAVAQALGQFEDIPDAPRLNAEAKDAPTNDALADAKAEADKAKAEADALEAKAKREEQEKRNDVEQRLGLMAQWSAVKDTSLRSALSNWARQSQMQLIWNGDKDLKIPRGISGSTRMENALESLLSQYDNAFDRPSIQINRYPDTGIVAMIVDIDSKPAPKPVAEAAPKPVKKEAPAKVNK